MLDASRWKARGIGGHVIPIAGATKSGIKLFKWAQRFCFTLSAMIELLAGLLSGRMVLELGPLIIRR